MSYDAVLLDFDGVVVNVLPEKKRLSAVRDRLTEELRIHHNGRVDIDDVVSTLAHSVSFEQLKQLSDRTGVPSERLWRARDDAIADVFTQAAQNGHKRPFDDVNTLSMLDQPIGIVSNNQTRVVESLSDRFELTKQFETIRARDPQPESLRRKKPEPTLLEASIRDLGVDNPLFVGDKATDIRAGQRANLDTVLLRRSHNADRQVGVTPTYELEGLDGVAEVVE